jgi:hypothetical protein
MKLPIFRSVSLRDDLASPERFEHYYPTRRSLKVTQTVLRSGACMVIAAYGSGKSLAAGVAALATTNAKRSSKTLLALASRIQSVDRALGTVIAERVRSNRRGRVVALSGYIRDLPGRIGADLGLSSTDELRHVLSAAKGLRGIDHIAIIWDEFGRHLEGLVADGRSRELDVIQSLAEWSARSNSPTASLTLLLHQNLLAYGSTLNQTSRNDWRKIEGRFEQVRFAEDSRELYRLIATIIASRRGPTAERDKSQGRITCNIPGEVELTEIARQCIAARWFDGMDNVRQVVSVLRDAYPVSAGALQILPRLVARVGQNERSLFSFLENVDLTSPVGMDDVYVAFSDALRSDVGVGGAYRYWIEAESARNKASEGTEREVLAAAFLLQLGVRGERGQFKLSTLTAAVRSRGIAQKTVSAAIEGLIRRKLLLYRKLNEEVSI